METYFAPASRTEKRKFKNQVNCISNSPIVTGVLEAANGILVILNEDRQIVAFNHDFLQTLGVHDPEEALGLRLGESLKCIHSAEEPNGCGTTPYCVTCGAAIAMMAAIEKNVEDRQVCALTAKQNGIIKDICLLITAKPFVADENRWILIYAQDITQQEFWASLEQIFFHDINNILVSLIGNSELLSLDFPHRDEVQRIREAAIRLSCEIALQRDLSHSKDAQYSPNKIETSIHHIREEVKKVLFGHNSLSNKNLLESWPERDTHFFSDSILISRILTNMIINALEATEENGVVKLTTSVETTFIKWQVWNKSSISPDVQKRIFQRHFSTKSGRGRGLGTYSMKLLGECYLGGMISFVSDEENGTTFTFRLPLVNYSTTGTA